jgi:hypothetical protein
MESRVVRILVILAMLLVVSEGAIADSISDGNLFAIFATGGTFRDSDGQILLEQNYTVVHFLSYASSPVSEFPTPLVPDAFPASGVRVPLGVPPLGEYFLLGGLDTIGEELPDHLLLSSSNPAVVREIFDFEFPPYPEGQVLHDALIEGSFGLTSGGPIYKINAAEFWSNMDVDPGYFFAYLNALMGNKGPVVNLKPGVGVFASIGSEEVFGFNPALHGGAFQFGLDESGEVDPGYSWTDNNGTVHTVPEPGTLGLLVAGVGLARLVRRRRSAA